MDMDRRHLVQLAGLGILAQTGLAQRAFGQRWHHVVQEWTTAMHRQCSRLLDRRISPAAWQTAVDNLYRQVPLTPILESIDFEAVRDGMELGDNGGVWQQIAVGGLSGPNKNPKIITKVVGITGGRTVPPHGHSNEASAFLTLYGQFDVRQWDCHEIHGSHVIAEPSRWDLSNPGDWSTQSDDRDNIHWLVTTSPEAYFFSIRVANINPGRPHLERIPLDPRNASDLGDRRQQIPIIDKSTWWRRYSRA